MARDTAQDAIVFLATREHRRIPQRAITDLMDALDDSKPLPRRVAVVRFWAIYFKSIGLQVPSLPSHEETTPEKLREIAEKLVEQLAKAIGITEEPI